MELVKELPEIFEEFAEQRQKSFLVMKEVKDKGIPVIGAYCTYFPQEIAMAMGAVTVGLCSTSDETIPVAEKDLPKNLCPMVKASYGFAVTDKCPFFYFSDVVVGETTCDGKKKMYELMKEFKNVYIMELPNTQNESALELWKKEIIRFKEYLEETFNTTITEEQVRHAVHVANQGRLALRRFYETMKNDPAPMEGSKLFNVLYGSQFKFDKEAMPAEIDALTEKIMKEYEEGEKPERRKRILLTGCPSSGAPMKVVKAIEEKIAAQDDIINKATEAKRNAETKEAALQSEIDELKKKQAEYQKNLNTKTLDDADGNVLQRARKSCMDETYNEQNQASKADIRRAFNTFIKADNDDDKRTAAEKIKEMYGSNSKLADDFAKPYSIVEQWLKDHPSND